MFEISKSHERAMQQLADCPTEDCLVGFLVGQAVMELYDFQNYKDKKHLRNVINLILAYMVATDEKKEEVNYDKKDD